LIVAIQRGRTTIISTGNTVIELHDHLLVIGKADRMHEHMHWFGVTSRPIRKVFIIGGGLWAVGEFNRSPYVTNAWVAREQPVQFSHEHHVAGLGLDCRYCHTAVEDSSSAGMPSTKTCMTCHSQIWTNAELLEPVRESWRTNQPIRWNRVHDLPDFAQFNHGVHVQKGVGCVSCHGAVNEMPLMWQTASLQMEWCLSCHREPEKHLRPRDQVFELTKIPADVQAVQGKELVKKYHVNSEAITRCSTCHY